MLKPFTTVLQENEITLRCRHAKEWPPVQAKIEMSLEEQRLRGRISEQKYEQVRVWERMCGQMKMGEGCLRCPVSESQMPQDKKRWQAFHDSKLYQALKPFINMEKA